MSCRARGIEFLALTAYSNTKSRKSLLLVSPEYEGVTPLWFSPDFWGRKAEPVTSGGRGGAWFIDAESASFVLRHYRRGGFMTRLAKKTYLFLGFGQARSLAEFQLLEKLRSVGLPVPEPVAAIAWKYHVIWYQAAIIVKRIPGAVTFADSLSLAEEGLWRKLGQVIRQFHDQGLNHVDLNCDNILVAGDQIYLIDFDRCRLAKEKANGTGSTWKQRNLDRLHRSIEKRCARLPQQQRQAYWKILVHAYERLQ